MDLFSVGINCALGPKEMRAVYRGACKPGANSSKCLPKCGPSGCSIRTGFPEPQSHLPRVKGMGRHGWLNIVGGCCGTRRAIRRDCESVRASAPANSICRFPIRQIVRSVPIRPIRNPNSQRPYPNATFPVLSLEPLTFRPDSQFHHDRERTNVTGSPKFSQLISPGTMKRRLAIARHQVEAERTLST